MERWRIATRIAQALKEPVMAFSFPARFDRIGRP
jgi:hypothetical protein